MQSVLISPFSVPMVEKSVGTNPLTVFEEREGVDSHSYCLRVSLKNKRSTSGSWWNSQKRWQREYLFCYWEGLPVGLVHFLEIGWFLASVRKALTNTTRTGTSSSCPFRMQSVNRVCHLQTPRARAHLSPEGEALGRMSFSCRGKNIQRNEVACISSGSQNGHMFLFSRGLGLAFKSALRLKFTPLK